jgi:hypothetical protein
MLLSPIGKKPLHTPLHPKIMSQMAKEPYVLDPDSAHNDNRTRHSSREEEYAQPSHE